MIKVTTRLVQVDVLVRGDAGPVSNLTQDDFRLFDQGKPQKIAFFSANGASLPVPAGAASAAAASARPSGNVFTNSAPAAAAVSTVIALDAIMTSVMGQYQAKQQLLKYLAGVRPEDRVAIFSLSGAVQLVEPFTGNSAELVHALDVQQWGAGLLPNKRKPDEAFRNARAIANGELASLVKAASGTFVQTNVAPPAGQVRQECIGLVALARYLARTPGRKNLFWYTDGFPLVKWGNEPQMYTDEVSQANHAFNDANVSVFPVDARGLLGADTGVSSGPAPDLVAPATGSASRGPLSTHGGIGSPNLQAPGEAGQDMMTYVARYTGGQAFLNSNDFTVPLQKIRQDSAVTYSLGFYPDSAALDSKRHTLKVEVDRKSTGLQFRRDYLATPDPPEVKVPEKVQIAEAIWSPVNTTGITLSVKAEKVNQPQPGMVRLSLSMERDEVTLQPGENGWAGTLAVVYDERGATGQDLGRISETLNLSYKDDEYQKLAASGLTYQRLVRPADKASEIRVIVYDRGSGRAGSVAVKW